MADSPEAQAQSAEQTAEASAGSLLEEIIKVTPEAEQPKVQDWLENLAKEVMAGTVTWSRNLTESLTNAIAAIDDKMSTQLSAIMHHPEFQKLEGSWRGLHHLVHESNTGDMLKIRVLNGSRKEFQKDLQKASEFDQSQLFKKIHDAEFDTPGGMPYGALIGDFEFSPHPQDMEFMEKVAEVAGASHCPFISAASPKMFGFESFTELSKPRDLSRVFASAEYTKWKSFRDTMDSRYVTLGMPRVLSRLPYGASTKPIEEFAFEEASVGPDGVAQPVEHDKYTWMNIAYVMGSRLTRSFDRYGWCTTIRGAEGGGKVEGLPTHVFKSDDGDMSAKCPTEIAITGRREKELSDLGFLPLCHYKDTDYAVFFGGQTANKPKTYSDPDASANARINAGLPYLMASSRIAHYLKCIARDKIGSAMERQDVEDFLKNWVADYVCSDNHPSAEMKAKYPLAQAEVQVDEIPGQPGCYNAVCHLRPWLFLEELRSSLRMVAKIKKGD